MAGFSDISTLDFTIPLSPSEWTMAEEATLYFGSLSFFVNLIALLWLNFAERVLKLHFIRVIQAPLLTTTFIIEGVFWIGTLSSLRIIPQTGVFLICDFWSFWLYLPLGGVASIALLFHRFWKFYQIIIRKEKASGVLFYGVTFIAWVPSLICGIILSSTTGAGPIEANGYEICFIPTAFQAFELAHIGLLTVCVLFIVVRLWIRNDMTIYRHEFNAACFCFCINTFIVTGYGVILVMRYQYTEPGRVLSAWLIIIASNTYIWAFIYRTLYDSIFRRHQAQQEFMDKKKVRNIKTSSGSGQKTDEESNETNLTQFRRSTSFEMQISSSSTPELINE